MGIEDNILAWTYLIMWILTLIGYQWTQPAIDGGTAVIGLYIVYAAFAIASINDEIFSAAYEPLKLFPYIYLYIMMMIALTPIIYHHIHPTQYIEDPNTRILKLISWALIICALALIPDLVNNFSTGLTKLFTDAGAGKEAYEEQVENATEAGSGISNIPAILYNACSDIAVFCLFYFLSRKKKNNILLIGLGIAIIINILMPITRGQRGGVIISVLTVIGGYMLFRRYISKIINRIFLYIGIIFISIIALPIIAITVSRFGEEATGTVGGFVNWYVGQGSLYFNNYGLDAGGTRNGDRTMNLFKRAFDSSTPKNYSERRSKYHNLNLDDNFFSTFVGDFTIDYGPLIAVFIFIIFNIFVLTQIRIRGDNIKVHQLLIIYFTLCISLQGGMTLFMYSDSGNLQIITFALLYTYLRYHEVLLEKFPIKTPSSD